MSRDRSIGPVSKRVISSWSDVSSLSVCNALTAKSVNRTSWHSQFQHSNVPEKKAERRMIVKGLIFFYHSNAVVGEIAQ